MRGDAAAATEGDSGSEAGATGRTQLAPIEGASGRQSERRLRGAPAAGLSLSSTVSFLIFELEKINECCFISNSIIISVRLINIHPSSCGDGITPTLCLRKLATIEDSR